MNSKTAKKLSTILIVIGMLMIAAALGMVIHNKVEDVHGGQAADAALVSVEEIIFNNRMNNQQNGTGEMQ